MSDHHPQAADIVIETVDKIQGMEYDIVIIDPVVTDNPGFLDLRRLNVLFSRARCGLYVVASHSRWKTMFSDPWSSKGRAYPLKQFAAQLERYSKELACPSKNEFYDPGEFEKIPETFTTPVDIRKALTSFGGQRDESISDPIPKEDEVKENEKAERESLKALLNLHEQRKVHEAEEREKRARENMERETKEREKMERRTLKRERKEHKARERDIKNLQKMERKIKHREAREFKAKEREMNQRKKIEREALETEMTNNETPGSETTLNESLESGETENEKAEDKEKLIENEVKGDDEGDHSENEEDKVWKALGAAMEQIVNIFRALE